MAAIAEFVGGLLLAAGLLTRPAATLIGVTMLVAVTTAHRSDPFFGGGKSKEMALLYLTFALIFLFTGPGRFSVDRLIARRRQHGRPGAQLPEALFARSGRRRGSVARPPFVVEKRLDVQLIRPGRSSP